MNLLNTTKIERAMKKHADARGRLQSWCLEMEQGTWRTPAELKRHYSASASFLGKGVAVFDIKGNSYRLVVRINYQKCNVSVRWFGTHPEYDKINAEEV